MKQNPRILREAYAQVIDVAEGRAKLQTLCQFISREAWFDLIDRANRAKADPVKMIAGFIATQAAPILIEDYPQSADEIRRKVQEVGGETYANVCLKEAWKPSVDGQSRKHRRTEAAILRQAAAFASSTIH